MQGTADLPQYTSVEMPFTDEPPHVPEHNPTGIYERDFELPAAWAGRRVVLHVGAAESVVVVTLNGRRVGVGKDAHLASEFDLGEYLRPGCNTLRLMVVKWSDATFIEDQDQWWHGGITRPVYLYTTEPVYLADVAVDAGLADRSQHRDAGHRRAARRGPPTASQPGWAVEARLAGHDTVLTGTPARVRTALLDPPTPADRALVRRHELYGSEGMAEGAAALGAAAAAPAAGAHRVGAALGARSPASSRGRRSCRASTAWR